MSGGSTACLYEPRPGAPRKLDDARIEQLIATTLNERPREATHWSTRLLANKLKVSQSTVSRAWRAFGLQPHRAETFKLSIDPLFIDQVRDIVGLYLNPPTRAQIKRGTHRSTVKLERPIRQYLDIYNGHPKPFVWTKSNPRQRRQIL